MSIGLFIFALLIVAAVAAFVVWFVKRSHARYTEAWGPLLPLVEGGSSKGSRMTGTYQGMPVSARVRAVSDSDNSNTTYFFEASLTGAAVGRDWAIRYGGQKLLGFGEKVWHVTTKDDALKARLEGSGEFADVAQLGYPTVTYKARRGEILYSEQVSGMFDIPRPERFSAQLELLARLARLNSQSNAA
jgi:hypothetical protein